ncbi:MAG: Holliday junction branch migration protein RuvA [Holosporales bacterium]|nr:Holliday junction branch migration protein RuvA [Holosporales bacterium]
MIAKIKGFTDSILDDSLVVDVNGIGYAVLVSDRVRNSASVGGPIALVTLQIFKQDAQFLCGFLDDIEKKIFEALISVHGVGIKSAMSVLSRLAPEEFAMAVATQDPLLLCRADGIGKKTAERILLELKDKNIGQIKELSSFNNDAVNDTMLGLISLGYNKNKVNKVLMEVVQQIGNSVSTDVMIMECIKRMA